MTTDLWMLVWSAMLGYSLPYFYAVGQVRQPGGAAWRFGNREQPFAAPEWVGRMLRAHENMTENLAGFAILVLVAHVAGKANAMTALGAMLFFWGRVGHAVTYAFGILYLRTVAFFVAFFGELLILMQLFR